MEQMLSKCQTAAARTESTDCLPPLIEFRAGFNFIAAGSGFHFELTRSQLWPSESPSMLQYHLATVFTESMYCFGNVFGTSRFADPTASHSSTYIPLSTLD